jgi:type IV secretory pathway TrbD component
MDSTDKPREIVIYQSANRPNLLLGGDRELVLVMVMVSGGLAFSLACWWGIAVAIVLWLVSVAALQRQLARTAILGGHGCPFPRHTEWRRWWRTHRTS